MNSKFLKSISDLITLFAVCIIIILLNIPVLYFIKHGYVWLKKEIILIIKKGNKFSYFQKDSKGCEQTFVRHCLAERKIVKINLKNGIKYIGKVLSKYNKFKLFTYCNCIKMI